MRVVGSGRLASGRSAFLSQAVRVELGVEKLHVIFYSYETKLSSKTRKGTTQAYKICPECLFVYLHYWLEMKTKQAI
jgi:hypothetical protein